MSASESAAPAPEPVKVPFSLEILPYIKTVQNQNGLRRAEYERYRQFCAKRLRRIRKGVHFLNGKHKYAKKELDISAINDKRYLEMLVMQAERAWAGAMECKEDEGNKRAKYHGQRRLGKAVAYSKQLLSVCEACADNRTQLEAQAYLAWMQGLEEFEREKWADAKAPLLQAKTIYDQLSQAVASEQSEFYTMRVDELTTLYRYALSKSDPSSTLLDSAVMLSLMNAASDDPALKLLKGKLDSVVQETQKQRAAQTSEISWLGQKLILKSPAVRLAFIKASEMTKQVEEIAAIEKSKKKASEADTAASKKAESLGHKLAAYDRLFLVWSETKMKIRDERAQVLQSAQNEVALKELELLMNYATFTEQSQMIVRNLLLVTSIEKKIDAVGFDHLEQVKPDEVVRMYESTLQLLGETNSLRNAALESKAVDPKEVNAAKQLANGRELAYKAVRCYYLGLSYTQVKKWAEALALVARAKDYADTAPRLIEGHDPKLAKRLSHLLVQIRSATTWIHAKSALETLPQSGSALSTIESVSTPHATLLTNLKSWDASYAQTKVVDFPPTAQPIAAKPVLFDLAFSGFEAPDLTAKAKAPKSGFFSSFWRS